MWELYWITRFDAICKLLSAILCMSGAAFGVLLMPYFGTMGVSHEQNTHNSCKKWMKICIISFISAVALNAFIPTTKEALAIYGIGGTIDYVKSNEKAKQLPDKVINALDRYVDSIANDSIQNDKTGGK